MIVYGKRVCIYALEKHADDVKKIYIAKKGILPHHLFERFSSRVTFLENKWAQTMSRGGNHQGILLEMTDFEPLTITDIKRNSFLLVLDGLTDTGNIGAIVRSSYALGVDALVISGIKQINYGAVTRTSSGALLDMPLAVTQNIFDTINELKQTGFRFYGASMDGESIQHKKFAQKRVLVLGSEDKGISRRVCQKIDEMISIEMKRDFDSLNVSAAAAILIHRMGYAVE